MIIKSKGKTWRFHLILSFIVVTLFVVSVILFVDHEVTQDVNTKQVDSSDSVTVPEISTQNASSIDINSQGQITPTQIIHKVEEDDLDLSESEKDDRSILESNRINKDDRVTREVQSFKTREYKPGVSAVVSVIKPGDPGYPEHLVKKLKH